MQVHGDTEAFHLPPSYSKRQLYCKWVWLCGYKVTKTSMAKSTYVTIVEMEPRINDDSAANPTWPIGSIATQVISWKTFLGFWKREYPNIQIRPKGADTCSDFLIFCQQIHRLKNKSKRFNLQSGFNEEAPGESANIDKDELANQLEKASLHVKMARCQRERYQHFTNVCIKSSNDLQFANVPNVRSGLVKKKMTLTMDMGQNVPCPSLSAEQAGKTYYMSPLVANILSIVDNSTDHLTAYVWKEGDANMGMNNPENC